MERGLIIGDASSGDSADTELSSIDTFLSFLVKDNFLSRPDMARAADAQRATGQRIDVVLTELGLVSSADLLQATARYLELPLMEASDLPVAPVLEDHLPLDFIQRHSLIPLSATVDLLTIGATVGLNRNVLKTISYLVGRQVAVKLASKRDVEEVVKQLYRGAAIDEADPDEVLRRAEVNEDDIQRLKDIASEAPIVRFVNRTILSAVTRRASDIHIEPLGTELRVRFRIDGVMIDVERLPVEMLSGISSRIKILAKLNIAERRMPQDGRTSFVVAGREVDLRVSTVPVLRGESIVLRILDKEHIELKFETLGFDKVTIRQFANVLAQPNGMFLVTGPTGSGKTTTLYTALKNLNTAERKIATVEDPIEYELEGVNQTQIKPSIGLDFAHSLRSILRQDPDIIMIGEMRDLDTASVGIRASLTGHLVLSTLHTNSAAAAITRLLDMGIEDFLLAATLKGVLAQRLLRTLCTHCCQPIPLDSPLLRDILPAYASYAATSIRPQHPVGCDRCHGTGYHGRTTIAEMLLVNEQIRGLISKGSNEDDVEHAAKANGMISLYDSALQKMLVGETSLEEALRVTRVV